MIINKSSEVYSNKIGHGTKIWQFVIILEGATIGENCNINCHTFIENDVVIGNDVTIKSGVYLWDGIFIHDKVFIGPNVTFTNDKYPRSKVYPKEFQRIIIHSGASIGAGAIILGGVTIGMNSIVAAGSIVTKDVPDYSLVKGSPAKIVRWINVDGTEMEYIAPKEYKDHNGQIWIVSENKLTKK
jgi:UDP-2-acetamido-3-amino-2,3-dideoxy-glucuronate N-acetyltransferase